MPGKQMSVTFSATTGVAPLNVDSTDVVAWYAEFSSQFGTQEELDAGVSLEVEYLREDIADLNSSMLSEAGRVSPGSPSRPLNPTSAVFVPRPITAAQFAAGSNSWHQEPATPPGSLLAFSGPSWALTITTPPVAPSSDFWQTSDDPNDRDYETWAGDEVFLPGCPYVLPLAPTPSPLASDAYSDSGYCSMEEMNDTSEPDSHYRRQSSLMAQNDAALYAYVDSVLLPGDKDASLDIVEVSYACCDNEDILAAKRIIMPLK